MKGLALALLALFGCDRVFGLEGREPEVMTDAAMAAVVSLEVPPSIGAGEPVNVTAKVVGVAGTQVTCSFSANLGSFTASDVVVTLDANGEAMPGAEYTAPAAAGVATLRATVGSSSMTAMITIRPPIIVGNDSMIGNGEQPIMALTLFGTQFTVASPLALRQVGVWVSPNNMPSMARIAVYDANRTLIAATPPVIVVPGRNVFPLTSAQTLPAAKVWVVTMFDQATKVHARSGPAADSYLALGVTLFNGPMPTMMPAGSTPSLEFSHFLVGI